MVQVVFSAGAFLHVAKALIILCFSKLPTNKSEIPNPAAAKQAVSLTVEWPSGGAGMADVMQAFSCLLVFDQIQTTEADNDVPGVHPENSSASG